MRCLFCLTLLENYPIRPTNSRFHFEQTGDNPLTGLADSGIFQRLVTGFVMLGSMFRPVE